MNARSGLYFVTGLLLPVCPVVEQCEMVASRVAVCMSFHVEVSYLPGSRFDQLGFHVLIACAKRGHTHFLAGVLEQCGKHAGYVWSDVRFFFFTPPIYRA